MKLLIVVVLALVLSGFAAQPASAPAPDCPSVPRIESHTESVSRTEMKKDGKLSVTKGHSDTVSGPR